MKHLTLFIKHQLSYLLFLLAVFVIPLFIFLEFSTYELPKVQYVFLSALFVSQYIFYNEKKYRKKIAERVTTILQRELMRVPSRKEVQTRSDLVIQYRGASIVISALAILFIMIYYGEF